MTGAFWWHDASGGEPAGPFTEDEIRELIAKGRLPPPVRIWSSRGQPWPPGSVLEAAPPRSLRRGLAWAVLLGLTGAGWMLFGLLLAGINSLIELPVGASPWGWALLAMAMAFTAALVSALWWRLPRRWGTDAELASGLRILALISAVIWLLPTAVIFRDTPVALRQAEAVRDMTFLISQGADRNTLFVEGAIGPGFGERLAQRLASTPDPARIFIDSDGGLVGEALDAAQAIEHRGVTVVAGEECASACIIVLMGGKRRLGPYGGSILFHATAPVVTSANAMYNWLAGQLGEQARSYLLRRGVPPSDLDEARRRGPQEVFEVPNLAALKQGVLTGLYNDDGELDPAVVAELERQDGQRRRTANPRRP